MPESTVIVDTGPLVAFFVESDARHEWAVQQFKDLPAPFLTCEPVLTETFHLLGRIHNGHRRFFDMLGTGLIGVDFSVLAEAKALAKLVAKYADQPMSLADACLVRMAERHPKAIVLTLDHHFRVYRKHGRQLIPSLMPPN